MPKQMNSFQNWVFTINLTEGEEANEPFLDIPRTWSNLKYAIWQLEKGEGTGREHLQGYVRFQQRLRLSGLKKLHATAHWEVRRGTHEQAKAYSSKEDTRLKGPWTIGDDTPDAEPHPGQRSDLLAVKRKLDEGISMKQIADDHFVEFLRYNKAFETYKRIKAPTRAVKSQVCVLVGPTGVGKSYLARTMCPKAYWLDNPRSKGSSAWWDGYDGLQPVIIDEFYGWMPYTFMLRLLDEYMMKVEIKGGFVNFNSPHIILTSNKFPEDWYDKTKCDFLPLLRRLDLIVEITSRGFYNILKDETINYTRHLLPNLITGDLPMP